MSGRAMPQRTKRTELVACDGCTACCQRELLVLHPELGDDPAQFETIEIKNPFTGEKALAIAPTESGQCRYLSEAGCSIYDRRPVLCRSFSCVGLFKKLSRQERRMAMKSGLASKEVIDAGRKRVAAQQANCGGAR
jgi:Fe-S-cluster containining protein